MTKDALLDAREPELHGNSAMREYTEKFLAMAHEHVEPRSPLTILQKVEALEHRKRSKSLPLVLSLLRKHKNSHLVDRAVRKMSLCGEYAMRTRAGLYVVEPKPCRLPICPSCSEKERSREARNQWRKTTRVLGENIDPGRFIYITIRFDSLPLGSDFRQLASQSRDRLRKFLSKRLNDSLWAGHFEISLTGILHLHAWVYCVTYDAKALTKLVKGEFLGRRAVKAKPMASSNTEKEFLRAAEYAADISLWVRGQGENTPTVIHDMVHSVESIRSRGRMGLRFEFGLRKIKPTSAIPTSDGSVNPVVDCGEAGLIHVECDAPRGWKSHGDRPLRTGDAVGRAPRFRRHPTSADTGAGDDGDVTSEG